MRGPGGGDDQSTESRAPEWGGGQEIGGKAAVQAQHAPGHKERRQKATQQKTLGSAQAHDPGSQGGGYENQGA